MYSRPGKGRTFQQKMENSAEESRLDNLRQQADELRQKMKRSGASMRPQSASRVRRPAPEAPAMFRPGCDSEVAAARPRQAPRRPTSAQPRRRRAGSAARKRLAPRPGHGQQHPDWVMAALKRKHLALGGNARGAHRVGRSARELIKTYGSREQASKVGHGSRGSGTGARPADRKENAHSPGRYSTPPRPGAALACGQCSLVPAG